MEGGSASTPLVKCEPVVMLARDTGEAVLIAYQITRREDSPVGERHHYRRRRFFGRTQIHGGHPTIREVTVALAARSRDHRTAKAAEGT